MSLDATERELAQVEKEPVQALAAREKAVVERVKSEKAMALVLVLVQAPGLRVGWERRVEVQETNVQAPAPVEGAVAVAVAGMGMG